MTIVIRPSKPAKCRVRTAVTAAVAPPTTTISFSTSGLDSEHREWTRARAGLGPPLPSGRDVPLHLLESTAYRNGMVALRYEVRQPEV